MARQIKRDSITHVYMVRLTWTGKDEGQTRTVEFGPYLTKNAASGMRSREVRNRNRYARYSGTPEEWTGEVLSAPVGGWAVEP